MFSELCFWVLNNRYSVDYVKLSFCRDAERIRHQIKNGSLFSQFTTQHV